MRTVGIVAAIAVLVLGPPSSAFAGPSLTWQALDPGALPEGVAWAGVYVGAPDGVGEPLLEHGADLVLNPASVSKLATAWLALEVLGPEHRFVTRLLAAGDDLVLQAGGDPALSYRDLLEMAARLRHRGRASFRDLVVDGGLFSPGTTPPHFDDKRTDEAFRAEAGPLAVDGNRVLVRVRPGAAKGDPALVTLYPPSPDVEVQNHATTGAGKKGSVVAEARPAKGRTVVVVSGRVPLSRPRGVVLAKKIYQPGSFGAGLVRQALASQGVMLTGVVRFESTPAGAKRLLKHASPRLAEIVGDMLRFSTNLTAELLLRHLDEAAQGKRFGAGALRLQAEVLRVTGLPEGEVRIANGSGLYDANRLSARAVGRLLVHALQGSWASEYRAALARAGGEGTLHARLAGLPFRGKTGTLDQSVTLAGVLEPGDGSYVPVVVLLQGELAGQAGPCREWMDRLVSNVAAALAPVEAPVTRDPPTDAPPPRPTDEADAVSAPTSP
jgi:D-alanyl-D-alanine carboxypeptidase/D-alanyl-D-alanine-endopeptidase (penicillin-binding protein 4)